MSDHNNGAAGAPPTGGATGAAYGQGGMAAAPQPATETTAGVGGAPLPQGAPPYEPGQQQATWAPQPLPVGQLPPQGQPYPAGPHWAGHPPMGYPPPWGHGHAAPAPANGVPPPNAYAPGRPLAASEGTASDSALTSLSRLIDFSDTEFWKGAAIGAAAVLLLTNSGVQQALFRTGAKAKQGVSRAFGGNSPEASHE